MTRSLQARTLAERIEGAGLSPEELAAFRRGLLEVASVNGFASMESALLGQLFERLVPDDVQPVALHELWPHADLFLTAALTVAVSDGTYGVEEARAVGLLAARLGCSVAELAAIEDRVFRDLQALGRALSDRKRR